MKNTKKIHKTLQDVAGTTAKHGAWCSAYWVEVENLCEACGGAPQETLQR
jgi:hypothetical protein